MFELKSLPYTYDALEPFISGTTVNIHYNKHEKGYLDKLNKFLKDAQYNGNYTIEEIILNIDKFPLKYRGDILYNAGGVINHDLYWHSMGKFSLPTGKLLEKIVEVYGSYDSFKQEFIETANKVVGSGYTFLVTDKNHNLNIISLSNQESPLIYGFEPLITIDLWEHAYYLDYQNRRADYIINFFSIVNFDASSKRYEEII